MAGNRRELPVGGLFSLLYCTAAPHIPEEDGNRMSVLLVASSCFTVDCGNPSTGAPPGFTFSSCTTTFGGLCTAACAPGYDGTAVTVTATADGTWSYSGACTASMCLLCAALCSRAKTQ